MPPSVEGRSDGLVRATGRTVTRLAIATGQDYEPFRQRYEQAVPPVDLPRMEALVQEQAPWSRMLEVVAENAPHGFMTYWRQDAQPLLGLAGDRTRCTEYLMGNHTIAERMFRHDAGALLYAPLRTTIHEDPEGRVVLSLDRPSDLFGVFDRPEISAVGRELDRLVGSLLSHLDLPVPAELT